MKNWRIAAVLLLCLALVGSTACALFGGDNEEETSSHQPVEVVRGDLIISVSGSGNMEVAKEASLAFGIGGKIDKIYVEEDDKVSEGDVLAQLDTDTLELTLTQAQLALTQAQLGVTQAEVALETAKFNLDRMEDVAEAKDAITDAEYELKVAQAMLKETYQRGDDFESNYWRTEIALAQLKLAEAQQDLAEILVDPDYAGLIVDEVIIKELQVKAAEESLEVAQQSAESAEQSLEQAQKQLDETTITAPCSGVIVDISADEGDVIPSPSVTSKTIIYLIDLTSMELQISVDEIDIPSVKLNQRAIINVDALPDLEFEGKVTSIGLLPTVEAGLTSYDVTIGLSVPENVELKVGMSATADIIITKLNDVLLVPSRAIKEDSQGNPVVKVMINDQIQEKAVVTGISDDIQTEIVSGLKEGDRVAIEIQATTEEERPGLFF